MRTLVTGALAAVLLAGTANAASANADPLGCSVSHDGGPPLEYTCVYVAATAHGRLTHTEWNFDSEGEVGCLVSGSGAWLDGDGTADYNQIPGEVCVVTLRVVNATGGGTAHGGSVL